MSKEALTEEVGVSLRAMHLESSLVICSGCSICAVKQPYQLVLLSTPTRLHSQHTCLPASCTMTLPDVVPKDVYPI